MDKLREIASDLWDDFGIWFILAGSILGFVILPIVGYSFFTTILIIVIVGFAMWRALAVLVNSLVIAVLFKLLSDSFKPLTAIWLGGPQHEQFFAYVQTTDYLTMILMVFLLLCVLTYTLDIVTRIIGSFQPIYIKQHIGDRTDD